MIFKLETRMIVLIILGTYILFITGLILIEYLVYLDFEKRKVKKREELEEKVKQLVREKVIVSKTDKKGNKVHSFFPKDKLNFSRLQLCLGIAKERPELIANLLRGWMEEKGEVK